MLDTPQTLPQNFLRQLFAPLSDTISCGLLVVEILQDGSDNPQKFVGKVTNRLFCELLAVSEDDILKTELPKSLSQTLALPSLLNEFALSGAAQIDKNIPLGSTGQTYTLQAHLPCPELLTIVIKNSKADRERISTQAEIILSSLGDPCTIVDRNFSVCYENEAAKKLWGSHIGKKCYAIYHNLQSRCESCHSADVFADGQIHKEEKLAHFNGSEHHMEITSAPLKDNTGKVFAVVNITRDVTSRKIKEKSKEHLLRELQASLAKTKRLNGLLPICSYCKKIKDENGAWLQLESYLRSHAEVEFSHSICLECGEKHHPQALNKKK